MTDTPFANCLAASYKNYTMSFRARIIRTVKKATTLGGTSGDCAR